MTIDLFQYQAVLLDLDGTVYNEGHPLPGAVELIRQLQQQRQTFACLSNSAMSPQRVVEQVRKMGIELNGADVFTAAAAACDYVLKHFGSRPRIFNLATESVRELLEGRVEWVQSAAEKCDAVVSGAPTNHYATEDRRRIALELLRHGASLVGLCADRVFPSPRGIEFGSGAQGAMLAYAANVTPIFCGKPMPIFFLELCQHLKVDPARCVLIGDNPESDIGGAKSVGMSAVLVLSGITRRADLSRLPENLQPDHVIQSLTELL